MTGDPAGWRAWIGRRAAADDILDPLRVRAMHAALDLGGAAPGPGEAVPPLWHWLCFWETAPRSGLGPDGHAARGNFLPPIDLPRRMWAGSRVRFLAQLPVGARMTRLSKVADVVVKSGRSGRLAFVTVRHRIYREGDPGVALEEEHDIVYREPPRNDAPARPAEPAPPTATWSMEIVPDPVLLFRYSALTFNGHRIHYDRPYAVEHEGYRGLVVHGPLLATLMAQLAVRSNPGRSLADFSFRALSPVFDIAPFCVAGAPKGNDSVDLWVEDADARCAMRGRASFAVPGEGA
jgi:3-methylfumaryl-CoA hydratase